MNRDQALEVIRERAVREPGRLVEAFGLLWVKAEATRAQIQATAGGAVVERHAGYLAGLQMMIDSLEESLFEAFGVRPTTEPLGWLDELAAPEGSVQLSREVWDAVIAALGQDATPQQVDAVRHRLIALAPDSWHEDLEDPGLLMRRLHEISNAPSSAP